MRREDDIANAHPLALERNLALMAGAGAGKTYSLVTICLHLLTDARAVTKALRPSQLYLMTFTDKAAGELRDRLRRRIEDLATARKGGEAEKILRESFARLDRPFPTKERWRELRDDLGASFIGTFHSLCVQLLRRAPPGLGVDPAFELLDERAAAALLTEVAERVVLAAVEKGDTAIAELCREYNFIGNLRSGGVVDLLVQTFGRIREEGVDPANAAITDGAACRARFDEALALVKQAYFEAKGSRERKSDRWEQALSELSGCLPGLTFENFYEPNGISNVLAALGDTNTNVAAGLKSAIQNLKYGCVGSKDPKVTGLVELHAACFVEPHERAFRALLCELRDRHREELDRRGVLDFSELLIRVRDLLRDHPAVRREVQARVGALLVDEFQDTNRLQLEIVLMLAEARAGAARATTGSDDILALPIEPAFLCAVGDRKQSIYEFRGADVSVFELLARQIEAHGGARDFLRDNYRSSQALLSFFNTTFAELMRTRSEPKDFEVVYTAGEDDLRATRKEPVDGPCVERLVFEPAEKAEECRLREADFLARRLKALLAPGAPAIVVGEDGIKRTPRGGDVALLFRAFTQLELYRQALIRHNIPHRVVGGRGFYAAQEVLDLASLLSLIADPEDLLSLTAVLRSPLVGVSDDSLYKLSGAPQKRLSLARMDAPLPADERARLDRFLVVFRKLRAERDRLGLRLLVKVALDELGYRTAVAGTSFGEQALANLDKLVELAGHWDRHGLGGCEAFARELLTLAQSEPREEQADTLDAQDPRAVQLLTIHRAKGLEWPIVVVPDLSARKQQRAGTVLYDRRLGLALKPLLPDGSGKVDSPRLKLLRAELNARDDAESRRLLYVALTRAKDRLILCGQRQKPEGWRKDLDAIIDARGAATLGVVDVRPDDLKKPPEPTPAVDSLAVIAEARAKIERARAPVVPAPATAVFPVTQLQDYFRCPRRYLYLHQIGLSERPMILELSHDSEEDELDVMDPRVRGTLAHKMLELVDYAIVREGGKRRTAHLSELLERAGVAQDHPEAPKLLGEVEAFLRTKFAQKLSHMDPSRVHRELPFLLRLGDGKLAVHLRGQIDLLVEDEEGGATIVDYKFAYAPEDVFHAYGFQLDCYALAARHFVQQGVAIRTGLAFLRGGPREPDFRDIPTAQTLDALETKLVAGAAALLQSTQSAVWSGLQKPSCQALRCGYQYRCHPETPAL